MSPLNHSTTDHATLMRRAALASLSVAVVLIALKLSAYLATDSVSMLASLADSSLDFFASAINLVAVRSALTPPDREHRFGHGKAEPLAGLAQGAFIAGSATFLIIESSNRLIDPREVAHETFGLIVMGISIVATLGLIAYQRMVVARTNSLAISADQTHYASDLVTNAGVVIALLLTSQLGWKLADPLIGIAIALFLAYSAWSVFQQSYDQLMDRELPDAERARIKALIMAHGEV
ncbi:MAG TPA: cation diffusion facilitator family transporter, partial [Rhizomicrobium sp.]|nr:cation diffusion facilitator family transporter [Rhizomicrobium sp.]